ncbi:MAG: hypothetical protein QOD92_3821 [Acidimicrobiaceae bacterium]
MTFAKVNAGRTPRFRGIAFPLAIVSIVAVPFLTFSFPRWAARVAVPLLAITSIGIYATVPDTERVILVMAVMLVLAVVCGAASISPHPIVLAAIAFVMMGTAILDSAGREAPIVRAAGCFGVLLVAPVAGWVQQARARSGDESLQERRPAMVTLVALHCVLVAWSSRLQIRETSVAPVLVGTGGALALGILVLLAAARPVAAAP